MNNINFTGVIFIDCWETIDPTITASIIQTTSLKNIKSENIIIKRFHDKIYDYINELSFTHTVYTGSHLTLSSKLLTLSTYKLFMDDIKILKTMIKYHKLEDTNWIVCGAAWQMCLHKNNIGFKQLIKLPINIFSTPDIVDTEYFNVHKVTNDNFINDNIVAWEEYPNNIYKLKS